MYARVAEVRNGVEIGVSEGDDLNALLSPESREQITRTLADLNPQFPGSPVERITMMEDGESQSLATGSPTGIGVSPMLGDDVRLQAWADDWRGYQVAVPSGLTPTPEQVRHAVMTHEYGHVMNNRLDRLSPEAKAEVEAIVNEPVTPREMGFVISVGDALDTPRPRWQIDSLRDKDGNPRSVYANENAREWFAEAFADGMANGDDASEASKRIRALVEKHLGGSHDTEPAATAGIDDSTQGDPSGPTANPTSVGLTPDRPPKQLLGQRSAALTSDEQTALDAYRGRNYMYINSLLWRPDRNPSSTVPREVVEKQLSSMESAMAKSATQRDQTLWRGMDGELLGDLQVGQVVEDKGFMSTSPKRDVAVHFATNESGTTKPIVAKLSVPAGTHAISMTDGPPETVLDHGQSWRVTKVTQRGGVTYVEGEILPRESTPPADVVEPPESTIPTGSSGAQVGDVVHGVPIGQSRAQHMTVSRIDKDPEGDTSHDILHGNLHSKSSPGDFRGGASMWRSDANPVAPADTGSATATEPIGRQFANDAEAVSYLDKTQGYLAKSSRITDADAGEVLDYTGMGGYGVNDALRSGNLDSADQTKVNAMDRVMAETYWPKPFVAWRGVEDDGSGRFSQLKVGDTFTDPGYSSTSLNPDVAEHYATTMTQGTGGMVLQIDSPGGEGAGIAPEVLAKRLGVDPKDAIPDDAGFGFTRLSEVVLPRNSTYAVTGRYQKDGLTYIQLRTTPPVAPADAPPSPSPPSYDPAIGKAVAIRHELSNPVENWDAERGQIVGAIQQAGLSADDVRGLTVQVTNHPPNGRTGGYDRTKDTIYITPSAAQDGYSLLHELGHRDSARAGQDHVAYDTPERVAAEENYADRYAQTHGANMSADAAVAHTNNHVVPAASAPLARLQPVTVNRPGDRDHGKTGQVVATDDPARPAIKMDRSGQVRSFPREALDPVNTPAGRVAHNPEPADSPVWKRPNADLSDQDKQDMYDYAWDLESYSVINYSLRAGQPLTGDTAALSDRLTALIDRSSLPADARLYRNTFDSPDLVAQLRAASQGDGVWTEPGFMSTSLDPDVAASFDLGEPDDTVKFEITVDAPKGAKALVYDGALTDSHPDAYDQQEILLQRGSRFRVDSLVQGDDAWHAKITLLDSPASADLTPSQPSVSNSPMTNTSYDVNSPIHDPSGLRIHNNVDLKREVDYQTENHTDGDRAMAMENVADMLGMSIGEVQDRYSHGVVYGADPTPTKPAFVEPEHEHSEPAPAEGKGWTVVTRTNPFGQFQKTGYRGTWQDATAHARKYPVEHQPWYVPETATHVEMDNGRKVQIAPTKEERAAAKAEKARVQREADRMLEPDRFGPSYLERLLPGDAESILGQKGLTPREAAEALARAGWTRQALGRKHS